ncbi:alpha/beta fold hydrolase [Ornithinicoccus halotolerans]|uniref:alpha/beta fold hydrolase n=1 Tax=Ornithinicoccus halotolerans TaxID=1748220 RepID=UPI00129637C7|nr:alpha/beta fold hydrolase [Ornithinicoccus halotolerans]
MPVPTQTTPTLPASKQDATRRMSRTRRLARTVAAALAGVLALSVAGTGIQAFAEHRERSNHPAPGTLVELPDGRDLHVQVQGGEQEGPTIVLESGAGASSVAWAWVQPALARHATVVSYDRAGTGWSDGDPHGTDVDAVITDLRYALGQLDLPGPYVLVGHSLGGHYVRAFAAQHTDEVAGMVLVDPSHEEATAVTGMDPAAMAPMFAVYRAATRLGLTRLYDPFEGDVPLLPEPQRQQALGQQHSTTGAAALAAEMAAVDTVGATLPSGQALGDLPLHVVIAGGGATDADDRAVMDSFVELRQGLTALSSQGTSTVLDSATHVSIVTDQAHAQTVTDAVLDVLDQARSTTP